MPSAAKQSNAFEGPSTFPETSWATILAARDADEKREPLDRLFRKYWQPVYRYIRRRWGVRRDDEARDLTQAFFLRLLETDFLRSVDPEKGRFRAYVKACLRHHLADVRKREATLKRGGGNSLFSLEQSEVPIEATQRSAEEMFDLEWARAVLDCATASLRETLLAMDRALAFELFRAIDLDPENQGRPSYAQFAERHGVSTRRVKSELDYARRTLRKLVFAHIREYNDSEEDAEAEFRFLFSR